jgi:hypothetical protein
VVPKKVMPELRGKTIPQALSCSRVGAYASSLRWQSRQISTLDACRPSSTRIRGPAHGWIEAPTSQSPCEHASPGRLWVTTCLAADDTERKDFGWPAFQSVPRVALRQF